MCTNPGLVPKPLPKLQRRESLGKVLGSVRTDSESVNGAKAGQKEAKEPSVTTEPSSSTELCLVKPADDLPTDEPSVLILDKQVPTASDLLLEEARRQTKKETAMVNLREKMSEKRNLLPHSKLLLRETTLPKRSFQTKRLAEAMILLHPMTRGSRRSSLNGWKKIRPPNPLRMADRPYKSSAIFLLLYWRASYPDFKSDKGDANGLGRRLPGRAWNYHAGEIPSFCQSKKVWGVDVDDIYAPVNFKNQHWFAIWISILKRHIVIWDSIIKHISPEELDEVMEPFVTMVPYLLVECAVSVEQKVQYTLEPYTYERQTVGVPQCRAGDCGPFTLKYIECHALGMEFPKALCPRNGKTIREKMAEMRSSKFTYRCGTSLCGVVHFLHTKQALCDLALLFAEGDEETVVVLVCRPFGVSLLTPGHDENSLNLSIRTLWQAVKRLLEQAQKELLVVWKSYSTSHEPIVSGGREPHPIVANRE
ncbi:hypothetical protein F2Q69_00059912 [Brassica cretica]|uniref:Ubiquitin-like protease family profile domain-containing protein n=1 Tax=Brassica cretica TaxID=69181 RepID=A0A8S9RP88_BRACR|nr:hypothetical protein F2Q69_00059912 [Brassica cretica]